MNFIIIILEERDHLILEDLTQVRSSLLYQEHLSEKILMNSLIFEYHFIMDQALRQLQNLFTSFHK